MMLIAMFMIILFTFIIMHAVPGGPFTNTKGVPEEVIAAMEEKFGLDQPYYVQFFSYLKGILHGDFGPSYKYTGQTVNEFISSGAPVSARLGGVTVIFVLIAAIPMGIWAALKNGKWQDMLLMALATIGVTIPSFVIASLLIYAFSYKLNWLPTYGLDSWQSYILPVVALGGYSISYLARLMRSSLLEVMGQDYIRTARAKGLKESAVLGGHALRNAVIPLVTVITLDIPVLFSGAVVTETIFSWPGMGYFFMDSINKRDYSVLMGILMISATLVILCNLLADILYAVLDPRIKY